MLAIRNKPREERVDVLVAGGGIVGATAAVEAARRGARVALVERAALGTATGSSKGTARIYTPAAYPDESYLEMGLRALEGWREIEAESGERLLWQTGALSVGEFAERQLPALQAAGVEGVLLSGEEVLSRFGVRLSGDRLVLYQPGAGVIRADRALAAILRLAKQEGVELRGEEPVLSILDRGESVEVETEARRWACSTAILAAGPWNQELLARAGINLPVSVSRQSVAYFDLVDVATTSPAVMDFEGDEPYALWDPGRGLKAALHQRGPVADPSAPLPDADPARVERLIQWVAETFPGVTAGLVSTESCLYTNTPAERFILERRGRITVAAACNGQGFQFAPATGERIAELALESAEIGAR